MKRTRLSRKGTGAMKTRLEAEYNDFSAKTKRGCDKFSRLNSDEMSFYSRLYESQTGRRSSHILNKISFYNFIDDKVRVKKHG